MLLLETALNDQTPSFGDGTARTQLSKQKLGDVLLGTLHPLANLGEVCEDGLLVAFTHTLRGRNLVALGARAGKVGMCGMEQRKEAV